MAFDFWALVNDKSFQDQAAEDQASGGGDFKNFEEQGEYDVTLSHAEYKQTKAGDASINMRVKADTGESGFWTLVVGHGGGTTQAAKIAQQQLAVIVKCIGRTVRDPQELNGAKLRVYVSLREGNDGKMWPSFRAIPGKSTNSSVHRQSAAGVTARPVQQVQEDDDDDIPF